ncbi:MAG: alpha/beta fold hydrolase [Pseudodonghicola sp.]
MPDAGVWDGDREEDRQTSRDKVISAIYEAVLRPELYDDFLELWSEHVLHELGGPKGIDKVRPAGCGDDVVICGAELEDHFRRAFDILERIGRQQKVPGIRRFIEEHAGYALLLRCDGSLLARSRRAERGDDQTPDLAGFEAHLAAGSVHQLHALLASCAEGGQRAEAVVLSTDLSARYLIARLQPGAEAEGGERLVVIEPLEVIWSDRVEALLTRSFGLSPAEVDLVRHLMAGRSLKQIAEGTQRSEHTVRNQSKSVLAKTGAPSQADLIRLVAVLCRGAGPGAGRLGGFGVGRQRMRDALGRGFELYEFGPPDGQPVLFLHGMLDAMAGLKLLQPELARRRLRVLAPVRAGYGHSEPLDRPDQAVEAGLAQADAIWSRFDLGAVPVIGHMAGAVHAFALAARHPDRVAAVLPVSGSLPFRSLAQFRRMARRQRIVSYTARVAPLLLPAILRVAVAQIDSGLVSDFGRALYPEGSPDLLLVHRPEVLDALCEAYRFSVTQGHLGFLGDAYFAVRDWSADVAATACPIHFFHGTDDPAVALEDVRALCAATPGAELTVLPDCGQLVIYQHPGVVLDRLAAMVPATAAAPRP